MLSRASRRLASTASRGGFAGIRHCGPSPIRSLRPASVSALWTANQFSGLKNCISARWTLRSPSFVTVSTGSSVSGSRPVQYMQVAMSIGAGMKSCTWRGLYPCAFRKTASSIISATPEPGWLAMK